MTESHDSQFDPHQPNTPKEDAAQNEDLLTDSDMNLRFENALTDIYDARIFVPDEIDQNILNLAQDQFGSIEPPTLWFAKYIMPLSTAAMIGIGITIWQVNQNNNGPIDGGVGPVAMNTQPNPLINERLNETGNTKGQAGKSANANIPSPPAPAPMKTPGALTQDQASVDKSLAKLKIASSKSSAEKSKMLKRTTPAFGAAPPILLAEDIDQSGRVDILDAFKLAKHLKLKALSPNSKSPQAWDFNKDGKLDDLDVRHVAMHAVAIKKGGNG